MDDVIFMSPVYKDYIWGGDKLRTNLNKESKCDKIAESWEISTNQNGKCKILNEEFKNKTLDDLFKDTKIKRDIFGEKCQYLNEFPLLIKFIDAKDNLSIQVHPDDEYACKIGAKQGKNELWYIIDCEENSQIIGGLNEKIEYNELKNHIKNDTLKNFMNYIDVKKGDSIYIKAGTVHAILKNNLICEIQQNCDITYRVYDWDRLDKNGEPRLLHKNEAIEVIKPELKPVIKNIENKEVIQNIVKSEYFIVDKINCTDKFTDISSKESFFAINVVKGEGTIKFKTKEIKIRAGDSFLIPSTLGKYEIFGKIEILKSYI